MFQTSYVSNVPSSVFIFITPSARRYSTSSSLNCPIVRDIRPSRGPFRGNTRKEKRKKGKKRQAKEEEKSIHNHLQSVHPRHFTLASTSPPFQWRVAPFYWHACWLTVSLSLSFSSSFSFIHHAHCASSVAANEPRPLSLAKNAISAMTFHQKMNIVRSTYLFNYWLEYLSFFHVISGNFDEISFQNV